MGWEEANCESLTGRTTTTAQPERSPTPLPAPFPWYGGKSRAASLIWTALGNVQNYVEPFAGSLAVLLHRPHPPRIETVNDKDAFLACVWRSIQMVPAEVASWCDRPPNEADQHAVHAWLVNQRETFTARLMGDPDFYDARVAGRWLYGICCWIGSGWCIGQGPWQSIDGQLTHLGDAGRGIHRQLTHLGSAGQGIHRKLTHLGNAGRGEGGLYAYMAALAARLRHVRVCCGDWTRVLGPSVTTKHGLTGIVFDPPYAACEDRASSLYSVDDMSVAHDVRHWCQTHGHDPQLRLVLCGYEQTHDALLDYGWRSVVWTANGGYGNQRKTADYTNKYRETLWLSPHCLYTDQEQQLSFFA